MRRRPEVPGQRHKAARTVGVTAPTGPVRGFSAPSVDQARCPRTHSRRPQPGIAQNRWLSLRWFEPNTCHQVKSQVRGP